ncbi:MAG: glutathione S-transferase family protein [Bdellovibrionota bacterium]|nr:glutathione S-transferase family protein [Bdellovibrionota bacterium]
MGHLRQGEWHNDEVATNDDKGQFKREESSFREIISEEHTEFKPEKDRYHLYVSYACPWAHRTLIARQLKNLEDHISVSVVHPEMLEDSWTFRTDFAGTTGDQVLKKDKLYEVYLHHNPKITTKVTVPILFDKKTQRIVNNESSEILRIFNSSFEKISSSDINLYPKEYQSSIDEFNEMIYEPVNNGVYKVGFATTQEAYEKAFHSLFNTLDKLDDHLKETNFLVSDSLTEADIRLLTTLLRFDAVYYTHFKCNKKKISEYKNLFRYLKFHYQRKEISSTTNLEHIKRHYFYSHDFINPNRIVPLGPMNPFI